MFRSPSRRIVAAVAALAPLALAPALRAAPDGQGASPAAAAGAVHRIEASDLQGTLWTPERLRGRVVLIDFWATWCAPCLAELPRLKSLRERYSRDEFEILGVMLDVTSRRTVVSWLNRHRIDWPQIHERGGYNGALPAAFGVRALPATVLVDADGRIAGVNLRAEALAARIAELVHAPAGPGTRD